MADYLILLTIGPVQEFIAAARRTRDLWAGSQLLSELSRTAAQAFLDEYNATLIFPTEETLEQANRDVANRILVEVSTEKSVTFIGEAISMRVNQRLVGTTKTETESIFDYLSRQFKALPAFQGLIARAQIADLVEIYWAAVERTSDYRQDRQNLEAAMAARKNTRDFNQPSWGDAVPKSSIDGLRESVIDEKEYPQPRDSIERRREIALDLFKKYRAKGAERLSGVDLLKRYYKPIYWEADFPSTSHFAALPLLARHKTTIGNGLPAFLDALRAAYREQDDGIRLRNMRLDTRFTTGLSTQNYDASILFSSRLEEDLEGDSLHQVRVALAVYIRRALNGSEPEPYYALLHADGDFMGKTIDSLAHKTNGPELHRTFSSALDSFAAGVRELVETKHSGALVYSGGDDVLAFLPLHTVVECAKDLADSFAEYVGSFSYEDAELQRTITPSLSVGVAICHHLEPLSDTLNLARSAEKIAKKVNGKNALAITLSKRGGGDRTISGSWTSDFYERLLKLIEWHRTGVIPDSAAYDLHNLIVRLGDTFPPAILKAEAIRIVKRKRGDRGRQQEANTALVKLAEALPNTDVETKSWNVAKFADELIITREFAKAQGFEEKMEIQGAAA